MNDPIKLIWKYKNNNRRVQYNKYIFIGDIVPKDIMKILEKIEDLDFYETLFKLHKNEYNKLESFYGEKWYDKFFNVYIMGHSCGISDRILLNSIFEHPKCRNIKIYYHKRDDGTTDYFEKTQEISRHFKPEYKSVMRNRIVPFNECKPLS